MELLIIKACGAVFNTAQNSPLSFTINSIIMIIFFVVYAFLLGTAMDIGCTIGTTEAAGGASRAGRPLLNVKSIKTNGADCCRGGKISQEGEAQPATAKPNPHPPASWPCRPELTGSIEKQATGGHYTLSATLRHETVLFFSERPVRTASNIATPRICWEIRHTLCHLPIKCRHYLCQWQQQHRTVDCRAILTKDCRNKFGW